MKKRVLSLLMALALMLSCTSFPAAASQDTAPAPHDNCPAQGITDVDPSAWYHDAVDYVLTNGIMSGYNPTTFGPGDSLSRAMVVQVLYNKEGNPAVTAENKFPDVVNDHWYYNAVRWANQNDVVSGYGDERFGPDDKVTIEQVAVILHNYAGKPAALGSLSAVGKYDDWAAAALRWCVANGILTNVPFTNATETATRAQTAQLLMNYISRPADAHKLSMRYDDRLDVTGMDVQIVTAGTPTSYQVGYGVEENKVPDTAVVTLKDNVLTAAGIGTAVVSVDGVQYDVTVTAAPISLLLLIGQSNMQGSEGKAEQSIICPDGEVYATYGDRYNMTVDNATGYAASALTGAYRDINVNGTTEWLDTYPIYSLNEAGAGKAGPDSGFGYQWVKSTGEKVWVVNAAHGGSAIKTWQADGDNYKEAIALFSSCQETLRKEITAGHFTLSHMGYFWCQGCSDETMTAENYVSKYLTMHENLKRDLSADLDSDPATPDQTLEFGNIIITLAGHERATGYRYEDGVYNPNDKTFFMTYEELEMRGQRVAQLWMASNPELPDINMVSNLGDGWVTMPDGSDRVAEYFLKHYENGTVDYRPQEEQKEEWYTPTTPKAVKDSIHYNQIGYNEVGREAVRNTMYLLGIVPEQDVPTTVTFYDWTGYRTVSDLTAVTAERPASLVVPVVSPIYRSKQVTYQVSEGLHYDYYDLIADSPRTSGTVTATGAQGNVNVIARDFTSYQWEYEDSYLTSVGEGANSFTKTGGTTATGAYEQACYELYSPFLLSHDQSWALEWKMTDPKYSENAISLFSVLNSTDSISITKDGRIALVCGENTYAAPVVDLTGTHIYRLANRDGSIVLSVDGTEAGTLTTAAPDLVISGFGTAEQPINAGGLEYIAVQESGAAADTHFHDWTDWNIVTKPTKETTGLKTRTCQTCAREDSFVIPAHVVYRWELQNNELVSVGKDSNPLTRIAGSIENNVFTSARYRMENPVELLHNQDWSVEFKVSGAWDSSAMRKILSSTDDTNANGAFAIALNSSNKRLTITQYSSAAGTHYQYGLFMDESFDLEQPHVFRLVNHVDDKGMSNVMLYVDGQQVGSMNTPIKDSYPADLLNTLDIKLQHIGSQKYHLNGGTLHYLQVEQSGALDAQ